MTDETMTQLAINTIRTLSIDAVQQPKSGHPGTPMALAPLVWSLDIWKESSRAKWREFESGSSGSHHGPIGGRGLSSGEFDWVGVAAWRNREEKSSVKQQKQPDTLTNA